MIVIKQLRINLDFPTLQSWYTIAELEEIPDELNPSFKDVDEIQNELEERYHYELCCCRFKIINLDAGSDKNPDIFVTPVDKEEEF